MGEFTIHPLALNISTGLFYVLETLKSGSTFHLTLFFLHLHHLTLPLIKGGDVLGVFAAHTGICVWGNRGAPVLPEIMRKKWELGHIRRKIVHAVSEMLTCSFSMCDVLASRCCVLGLAGELRGGSVWVLVPAVWTLDVFSRIIGGLLRGQRKSPVRAPLLLWVRDTLTHSSGQKIQCNE